MSAHFRKCLHTSENVCSLQSREGRAEKTESRRQKPSNTGNRESRVFIMNPNPNPNLNPNLNSNPNPNLNPNPNSNPNPIPNANTNP